MLRVALLTSLALGLVAAAPASSAEHGRVASHCSASGDVCYGIFKDSRGVVRFKLTTAARYFARYRICVRPQGRVGTCKSFSVRKLGANWGGTVVWQRHFQVRSERRYIVTWKLGARRLGPSLAFKLPPPVV